MSLAPPATLELIERLHNLMTSSFDAGRAEDRAELAALWRGAGHEQPLPPADERRPCTSERWLELGFQNSDPASDLRGVGLLGLHCLVRAAGQAEGCKFPWALCGINLCLALAEILRLAQVSKDDLGAGNANCAKLGVALRQVSQAPLCTLLAWLGSAEPFEDVFCALLRSLATAWSAADALEPMSVMDFPPLLECLKVHFAKWCEDFAPNLAPQAARGEGRRGEESVLTSAFVLQQIAQLPVDVNFKRQSALSPPPARTRSAPTDSGLLARARRASVELLLGGSKGTSPPQRARSKTASAAVAGSTEPEAR